MKKFGFKLEILLLVAFFITFAIRILLVSDNNIAFTMDQGRDMIDIRSMVVLLKPKLVGPTTSINGVFLGPLWYYFNLPPFIFGGGDPLWLVYWQILWFQITGIVLWIVFSKQSKLFGVLLGCLYLLMPVGFSANTYSWNANAMLIFSGLYFSALFYTISSKKPYAFVLLGLTSGFGLQIEAALGVLFFPFALLYLSVQRQKIKLIVRFILGFLVTLFPQIIFEIRNNFVITMTFTREIASGSNLVGQDNGLPGLVFDRLNHFTGLVGQSVYVDSRFLAILGVGMLVFSAIYFRKTVITLATGFVLFTLGFFLLYSHPIKYWYLLGLCIPITIVFSAIICDLISTKKLAIRFFGIALLLSIIFTALSQNIAKIKLLHSSKSNDPSNLSNQLFVIDQVYRDANGKPFRVYSHIPSVYDYPYNYLFWWYGTKQYGYQPSDVSYLPDQPEYIANNKLFWNATKTAGEDDTTFLIIQSEENDLEYLKLWYGHFKYLCLVDKLELPWKTIIEKRVSCAQ